MHIRAAAISVHKYRMFQAAHKKQGSPSGTATGHATSGNVTEHAAFAGGTATEHATSVPPVSPPARIATKTDIFNRCFARSTC